MPLADEYRPNNFNEIIGQKHLIGNKGLIKCMVDKKEAKSIIMYGPPGIGKTTTARILAKTFETPMFELNATTASVTDIKKIINENNKKNCIIYLDEIQYFNKKQQQSLLSFVESGSVILIASTTENPYYEIYDALLSRCIIVEFKKPKAEEIAERLKTISKNKNSSIFKLNNEIIEYISKIASGDVRKALNTAEIICCTTDKNELITTEDIKKILPSAMMASFDKNGNAHYQYISALQKSIRGSDPDGAIFWLSKLLEGGDIISPCRRLPVICCEDIGLAYPDAITHTMACCQAAEQLGLPEAYKPLTQAVILLALAPKSYSNEASWMPARDDIKNGYGNITPNHLSSTHAPGYVWPQDKHDHWYPQEYLPKDLIGRKYYKPCDNTFEQNAYRYWENIKKNWHNNKQ